MARITEGTLRFADLQGPRWNMRKFRKKMISKELYKDWKKNNPGITFDQFKHIWKLIATQMQLSIIQEPDGLQLPNGMGKLYVGYVKLKNPGIDYKTSKEHGVIATFDNYHSYGKPAKIIYHPCGKYKISTCNLWNFKAITPFRKRVSQTLRDRPEIYKNSTQKQYHGNPSNRAFNISTDEPSKAD